MGSRKCAIVPSNGSRIRQQSSVSLNMVELGSLAFHHQSQETRSVYEQPKSRYPLLLKRVTVQIKE